jgi:ABC-type bacteriocin/lantibiotic exporter with double-glycine peptidase domain
MLSWYQYLKGAFARKLPHDKIGTPNQSRKLRSNLKNLLPFFKRHWPKGVVGALLVLLTSLLSFPGPLINRYLIDRVILGKNLSLLLGAVFLLAGIKAIGLISGLCQQFLFTRFEQEVLLDIQQVIFDRTLRLPKSFFDSK